MAGRNRSKGSHDTPSGLQGGPGPMFPPPGAMMPPLLGPPQGMPEAPMMIEQKLATQHGEIQRLLMENQRFAATHVALRQELAAAQQEIQRLQDVLGKMEAEHDQRIRELVDKTGLMEADLRAMEPLRIDLERLSSERQELHAQMQRMSQESQRAHGDLQQIPALRKEVDSLNEELQLARLAFEQERKVSTNLSEQKQAMEKNMISLAREIEKLRTEVASAEKRALAASSAISGGALSQYNSQPQNAYGNGYPMSQAGALGSGGNIATADNRAVSEVSKYSSWPNSSSGAQALREQRVESASDWSVHVASNGQTYYYNAATGVTQLEKPATILAAEGPGGLIQGQSSLQAASYAQQAGSQHTFPPMQQQQQPTSQSPFGRGQNQAATAATAWQTQPPSWTAGQPQNSAPIAKPGDQTTLPQQSLSPNMPDHALHSHTPQGINLIVHGVPDDFTDHKLADLFLPFGPVQYAKILLDKDTGRQSGSGFITMDNLQGAEAAANAINGMQIAGKRVRVEMDRREIDMYYQQQQQQQQLLQAQSAVAGGAGPVRWQQRNEYPGTRPY